MSVTQYYYRLHDDGIKHFRDSRETFRIEDYPDGESIQMYGDQPLILSDLVRRAKPRAVHIKLLSDVIMGWAGDSIRGDNDYPYLIDPKSIATASRLMNTISHDKLRSVCDLKRLRAKYRDVEDWLWESWGEDALEKRFLPHFDMIRDFLNRAAERQQSVIAGWF